MDLKKSRFIWKEDCPIGVFEKKAMSICSFCDKTCGWARRSAALDISLPTTVG